MNFEETKTGVHRSWLLVLVSLSCASICGCSDSDLQGESTPLARNVVVIVADDLGYVDVSAYNPGGQVRTPNIDRIGAAGVRFTDGYVTGSVCSPSRAAMLTGRYQHRFGFEYNAGNAARADREGLGLDPDERTIGDVLRSTGMRTAFVGKWHQGTQDQFYPTARGYDEFFGFLTGQTAYINPDVPGAIGVDTPRAPLVPRSVYSLGQVLRGADREVVENSGLYLTEEFTREAVEFIDRNRDRPFYLHVAYHAPHVPLQTTQKYYDRFPDIDNEARRVLAGMVSAMDDGVGAIMERLEHHGLTEDTLVVYLSDNGCAFVSGACSCEVLRGGKVTVFEGGVRVPYLMQWPRGIADGQVDDRVVSSLDLLPTIASAVGVPLPDDRDYDGVDLVPYLSGETPGEPHDKLFWRAGTAVGAREGDWKLWESRDGDFTFLFDLATDLGEENDLSRERIGELDSLRAGIENWERGMSTPAWEPRVSAVSTCDGFSANVLF
jgi:arylsulfatase A-like enzyme